MHWCFGVCLFSFEGGGYVRTILDCIWPIGSTERVSVFRSFGCLGPSPETWTLQGGAGCRTPSTYSSYCWSRIFRMAFTLFSILSIVFAPFVVFVSCVILLAATGQDRGRQIPFYQNINTNLRGETRKQTHAPTRPSSPFYTVLLSVPVMQYLILSIVIRYYSVYAYTVVYYYIIIIVLLLTRPVV